MLVLIVDFLYRIIGINIKRPIIDLKNSMSINDIASEQNFIMLLINEKNRQDVTMQIIP